MPLPVLRPFRVTRNKPLASDAYELTLVPDDGQPMFEFVAGQWVMLHLLNDDGTTWKAAFSIASAPAESKESYELAIKIYGDFTKRGQELKPGDIVKAQGPYGVFTLRPGTEPLILFAAGIGVTPFRSMMRELVAKNDPREVVLFYTNKTRETTSYETELRELMAEHPSMKTVFILTREEPAGWDGEIGRLNEDMVKRHLTEFVNCEYAMCGPREFMDAIKEMLIAEGVDVKAKLRKELFD